MQCIIAHSIILTGNKMHKPDSRGGGMRGCLIYIKRIPKNHMPIEKWGGYRFWIVIMFY